MIACWLSGHEDDLLVRPGKLAAVCRRCGRETTGIDISQTTLPVRLPGDPRKRRRTLRRLTRAWLGHRVMAQKGEPL